MKKKASLWISGITTVAMLAVAVGSFAAWNTLSASTTGLTVKTGTSTAVTVTKGSVPQETKLLVPSSAMSDTTVYPTDTVVDEFTVGNFDLAIKGGGDNIKVAESAKVMNGAEDVTNKFDVLLYKKAEGGDYSTTALTTAELSEMKAGDYKVTVKFVGDGDTDLANNDSLAVTVTCDATYVAP